MASQDRPPSGKRPGAGKQSDRIEPERDGTTPRGSRSSSSASSAGPLPDLIRRVASVGLSGFFTTEEAVRKALGDTVPKDWVDFAADQGIRARSELADRLAEELRHAVESTDLAEVIGELMAGKTLEIDAKIRLVPDERGADEAPRPSKKTPRARARRATSGRKETPPREGGER